MRAIVVDGPGGPERLRIGEVPAPVAAAGEVLLRVAATAVNRADVLQRMGLYPPPPGVTDIIGMEASGTIDSVGAGVEGWRPGERVCALLEGGGYAERVAVAAGQLLRVPDGMDLLDAAAIPEVFITAYDNLLIRGRLCRGETALIHGGSGGVGTAAIQLAHRAGARVIATAGSAERLRRCAALGADAGINHRDEDFVSRARDLTGGRGVDVILDVMGASYLERNLEALASEGRLVIIGLQGGLRGDIDLNLLMRRRLTVTCSSLRIRSRDEKAAVVAATARDVMPGFDDRGLRPVVDRVLPLEQAADAHRALEAGEVFGKVVLRL